MAAKRTGIHSNRHRLARKALAEKRLPCYLCGQPIDYSLSKDDPMHFQLEHKFPWKTHPELEFDPANHFASHARCNKGKSDGPPMPELGETSEAW